MITITTGVVTWTKEKEAGACPLGIGEGEGILTYLRQKPDYWHGKKYVTFGTLVKGRREGFWRS